MVIEVFKTNVQEPAAAQRLVGILQQHYFNCKINFDLSDCDRILRVEGENICPRTIGEIINNCGYQCEVLE